MGLLFPATRCLRLDSIKSLTSLGYSLLRSSAVYVVFVYQILSMPRSLQARTRRLFAYTSMIAVWGGSGDSIFSFNKIFEVQGYFGVRVVAAESFSWNPPIIGEFFVISKESNLPLIFYRRHDALHCNLQVIQIHLSSFRGYYSSAARCCWV